MLTNGAQQVASGDNRQTFYQPIRHKIKALKMGHAQNLPAGFLKKKKDIRETSNSLFISEKIDKRKNNRFFFFNL